jgi:hypothetical protein
MTSRRTVNGRAKEIYERIRTMFARQEIVLTFFVVLRNDAFTIDEESLSRNSSRTAENEHEKARLRSANSLRTPTLFEKAIRNSICHDRSVASAQNAGIIRHG